MHRSSSERPFYFGMAFLYAAHTLWTTILLWQILVLTHSSLLVSAAVAAGAIPTVIVGLTGPASGLQGKMALWMGGFGLLLAMSSIRISHAPWALLVLALVESWIDSRVVPQAQAWLMANVPPANVSRASSRFEIASRTGIVAGPLMAGLMLSAMGASYAIMLTALLFLIAATFTWTVRDIPPIPAESLRPHRGHHWKTILSDRFLRTALAVRACSNLVWPTFTVAIPLMIVSPWHAHALGYGTVRALWGLSTVIGTIVVIPYLLRRLKVSYFISWILTGTAFWGIGASTHLGFALLWVVVGALSAPVVHIALDSHIGRDIPKENQAAVFAIQRLVMAVATLAGLVLVSATLTKITPGDMLSGAGIIMIAMAGMGLILWQHQPPIKSRIDERD